MMSNYHVGSKYDVPVNEVNGGQDAIYPHYHDLLAVPPMHPLASPTKKMKVRHDDKRSPSAAHETLDQYSISTEYSYSPINRISSPLSIDPPVSQARHSPTLSRNTTSDSNFSLQNPYSTSRGLRQFSMKVCEKVEEKGTTTYNEVADEVHSMHLCPIYP